MATRAQPLLLDSSFQRRPPASLAPVLGVRQDASIGVDTSRGLLLTILGEFVLAHAGRVWTQTLLELLELLDVNDKAGRQALARMRQRGWLEREQSGRQARWVLTQQSRQLLEPGARRIYEFGQSARRWDGQWVVVLASVPERDRHLRYRLTTGLSWAGFGSVGQGVWLSPWLQQERPAVALLAELGIDAKTFRSQLGDLGEPQALAAQAWDLVELRERYSAFMADTELLAASAAAGRDAAAALTWLVHRWRRFPFLDPDLPGALLADDWPGPAAARRFADLRDALRPEALAWWAATDAAFDPNR
jgi:phenylacetic acid degradation operon negative regulatory protein